MANVVTNISRAQFAFTFYEVSAGHSTAAIQRRKFKLSFKTVFTGAHYREAVSPASFDFALGTIIGQDDERAIILPASFFILTSRTEAEGPQPVSAS